MRFSEYRSTKLNWGDEGFFLAGNIWKVCGDKIWHDDETELMKMMSKSVYKMR